MVTTQVAEKSLLSMFMFLSLTLTSPSFVVLESVYQHLKLVLSCTPSPRNHESCTMVTT